MSERAVEAMAKEIIEAAQGAEWWPPLRAKIADDRIKAIITKHLRPPAQPASEREAEIRDLVHIHTVSPHPADPPPEPWFSAVRDLLAMLDAARAERDAEKQWADDQDKRYLTARVSGFNDGIEAAANFHETLALEHRAHRHPTLAETHEGWAADIRALAAKEPQHD